MSETATTEMTRPAGFNADRSTANSAYKAYKASVPAGETALSFKEWLTKEQAAGNYTSMPKVHLHGWKKEPHDKANPSQPQMQNLGTATTAPETAATAAAKTSTDTAVAQPFKVLGMHPLVGVIVISAAIYIGVKLIK